MRCDVMRALREAMWALRDTMWMVLDAMWVVRDVVQKTGEEKKLNLPKRITNLQAVQAYIYFETTLHKYRLIKLDN